MGSFAELYSTRRSTCCRAKQQLVRSREGGLVTKGCVACGASSLAGKCDRPELECGKCGSRMGKYMERKNYAYECVHCGNSFELHTILPSWYVIFPEDGLAAPGGCCGDEY